MTPAEREKLIERLITLPKSLSAEEIEAICADEELSALYHTASMIKGEAAMKRAIDEDEEWESLKVKLTPKQHRNTWRKWAAAAGVAVALVAGATAVIGSHEEVPEIKVQEEPTEALTTGEASPTTSISKETIYDNVPLASIAGDLGNKLGCTIKIESPEKGDLRMYLVVKEGDNATDIANLLNSFESLDVTIDGSIITIK